ncbi:type II secretion system F family protein [Streptomyces sp. ET3-23]|uniref:type II secretion system F family protein n=1 Tax=Streptomyces sp. ET3-23 TaxID=2885643 RepID=UPI001D108D09|nr:type II secretion system F family protein [Streptomyces sp. ET3-23]MCC2280845.1 type II secretion system F family protein [Streptomyces sp. ET3-23]
MTISTAAVLAGCTVGTGLALLVRALVPHQPALEAALRRTPANAAPLNASSPTDRGERWGRWLIEHVGRLPGVRVPYRELNLLGQTPGRFVLVKAALAVLGLLVPSLAMAPWLLLGAGLPLYLPPALGLVLAASLYFVPDLSVRDQARRARAEFAHAVAAYLDLVALKRAADAGPSEALERAAAVGHGWAFQRLQQALLQARIEKVPPWQALETITHDLGLPHLADVAGIMRLSASDGAAVYATLRARARSLRAELLAEQATEANTNSEKMTAPGALLAVLVMLLIAFPAVIRILTT